MSDHQQSAHLTELSSSLDGLKSVCCATSDAAVAVSSKRMEAFSYEQLQNLNLEESNILKHLAKDIRISSSTEQLHQYPPSYSRISTTGAYQKPCTLSLLPVQMQQQQQQQPQHHFQQQTAQKPPMTMLRNSNQRSHQDLTTSSTPSPKLDVLENVNNCESYDEGTALYRKQDVEALLNKVSKLQKLETEVENIQQLYLSLLQSTNKRELLEKTMRSQLENEKYSLMQENQHLKDRLEKLTGELSQRSSITSEEDYKIAIKEREIAIARLTAQVIELGEGRKRQDIELDAQRATLDEQRNHISILDSALTDAQARVHAMEDELRKKSGQHVERVHELQQALATLQQTCSKREHAERSTRLQLESENGMLRKQIQKNEAIVDYKPHNLSDEISPDKKQQLSHHPLKTCTSRGSITQLEETVRKLELQLLEKDTMVKNLQSNPDVSSKATAHPRSTSSSQIANVKDSVSGSATTEPQRTQQSQKLTVSAPLVKELWQV